ncbi:hypothetical protein AAFN85_12735 [Mucilaginibacter sp. CAU 1740]|uniref:hypothetical protein n=1 Tax=Mucilaginibacter sp. CAU 1740 TaxID=3140365 RepID=UPI00325B847A
MNNNIPSKCVNCGAGLVPAGNNSLKCSYCGSLVNLNSPVGETHSAESAIPDNNNTDANTPASSATPPPDEAGSGCVVVFVVFAILLVAVLIGIANRRTDEKKEAAAVDSLNAAKAKQERLADSLALDNVKKDKIKKLSLINVDSLTFKKLYKAANKDKDVNYQTFIYDQTRFEKGNFDAIDYYIYKGETERSFHLKIDYTAQELLYIKSITFNVDGKIYNYAPTFSTVDEDTIAWEKSDEIAGNADLLMLAHIATSKKTTMQYNGKKRSLIITVPPRPKAALKRLLRIYKGLLLGYDQ